MATNKHCTPIGCTLTSSNHSLTCTAHRTLSHARHTDIKPSLSHMHGTPTSSHHSLTCTTHRHQASTLSHARHTDIHQASTLSHARHTDLKPSLSHMHGTPTSSHHSLRCTAHRPPAIPHSHAQHTSRVHTTRWTVSQTDEVSFLLHCRHRRRHPFPPRRAALPIQSTRPLTAAQWSRASSA